MVCVDHVRPVPVGQGKRDMRNARFGMVAVALTLLLRAEAESTSPDLSQQAEHPVAQPTLADVLAQLERQQEMLDRLSDLIERQRKTIDDLSARLAQQEQALARLSQLPTPPDRPGAKTQPSSEHVREGTGSSPVYGAEVLFQSAMGVYRTALFDVRRKDAAPYYQRAIREFRTVIEQYPDADRADDALFYICKIYTLKLKDSDNGRRECEAFLYRFPGSPHEPEVREFLRELVPQ